MARKPGRPRSRKPPPAPPAGYEGAATVAAAEAVAEQPTQDLPSAAELAELLETGDLDYLRQQRAHFAAALERWRPRLGVDRSAVMSVRTLTEMIASLTRTIVELSPQPEVEAQRLEALGAKQRDALLARAQAATQSDDAAALRQRVAAQAAMIDALAGGGRNE